MIGRLLSPVVVTAVLALTLGTGAIAESPPASGRIGKIAFKTTHSNGRYHYVFNAKTFPCGRPPFGCAVAAINTAMAIRLGQTYMHINLRGAGCKQSRKTSVICTWGPGSTDSVASGTASVVTDRGTVTVTIQTLTCDPLPPNNMCLGH